VNHLKLQMVRGIYLTEDAKANLDPEDSLRRVRFSFCDYICMHWVFCGCCTSCRECNGVAIRKRYLDKGMDRINSALDVASIVEVRDQVELLGQVLFTEEQRKLLKTQAKHKILTYRSESEEDSQE